MAESPPAWTPDVERAFKEVLFRFLEEVHCTKAALYLAAPDDSYALAVQYGFGRREQLPAQHRDQDPMSSKVRELRNQPLAVNELEESPELTEHLRSSGTSRMLLIPLWGASRVLGFVDARDKGGQRPFGPEDLHQGAVIGEAFLELLKRFGLYPEVTVEEQPADDQTPRMAKRDEPTWSHAGLDDGALHEVHDALVDTVVRDRVMAAVATVATPDAAATIVYTSVPVDALGTDAITRHQAEALHRARRTVPHPSSWKLEHRRLPASDRMRPTVVASTIPIQSETWSLVLSVVGGDGGGSAGVVLERLGRIATRARERTSLRYSRRWLARRLLEPGEHKYPDLVAHSLAVSRLCWLMARMLEFDEAAAEHAMLAGIVHDVGMRELDYDRLYRHPSPSSQDLRVFRQHVVVGERIVHGTGLEDVERAVRHHHERWDGQGYPDQLTGESIPLLARLVHIAEVFDVLTSSSSYRTPVSTEQALAALKTGAGQQFDADLVRILSQVIR
jgi:hypothetical protein